MLLNVLSRTDNGCRAMRDLIRVCHETPVRKKMHRRRTWQLFRSLVERGIVEILDPKDSPDGRKLRVNMELQEDFSMDQTLSLYLLETISLVDPEQEDYALVVLTLTESILENPEIILRKQLDRIKGRAIAEMKMQGMDYEDRMEALEALEYPKPHREFIYTTFNEFADRHPWVEQENIRPKSIAREMFETFSSFTDYVRSYDLQRSEGLLLRHIHSVYKVLLQTVPDNAKDATLREIEVYLSETIRLADSSLLDEWEKMRDPAVATTQAPGESLADAPLTPPDITQNSTTFTAAIRTRIFAFLRAVADRDGELAVDALGVADGPDSSPTSDATAVKIADAEAAEWSPERLAAIMPAYLEEHERLCFDPEARNIRHTYVRPAEDGQSWNVQQMLVDPEAHNDRVAEFEVHLPQCREQGEPVLHLVRVGLLVQ